MARTELRGQHHCRERREDAGDHERDERVADHAEIGTTTALVDGIATYQTSCDGAGENSTHVRDGGCSVSLREKGPSSQCRSLNAVSSGARAVTTISTQWTLDRPGVAAVRASRGQDEQCEFVVEGVEAAWQHARTRGPRR